MNQGVSFPLGEARVRLDAAELMIRKASWLLRVAENAPPGPATAPPRNAPAPRPREPELVALARISHQGP